MSVGIFHGFCKPKVRLKTLSYTLATKITTPPNFTRIQLLNALYSQENLFRYRTVSLLIRETKLILVIDCLKVTPRKIASALSSYVLIGVGTIQVLIGVWCQWCQKIRALGVCCASQVANSTNSTELSDPRNGMSSASNFTGSLKAKATWMAAISRSKLPIRNAKSRTR